jgi:crotonobetainyl-CoA:carnitine CoA-transferase CaiB-like acyl-CoA transferase
MFAAFAVVSALFARERTGKGTYIDVSMTDCLVSWLNVYLDPKMNRGTAITALLEPGYGAFRCADDRTITLSIAHEDHFWRSLCIALDLSAFQSLNHNDRVRRATELRQRIQSCLGKQPLEHWGRTFDEQGIPWGPLNDLAQVLEDRHFRKRGLFVPVRCADETTEWHVRQPIQFSAYGTAVLRPAPKLGQHTREVLQVTSHGRGRR